MADAAVASKGAAGCMLGCVGYPGIMRSQIYNIGLRHRLQSSCPDFDPSIQEYGDRGIDVPGTCKCSETAVGSTLSSKPSWHGCNDMG